MRTLLSNHCGCEACTPFWIKEILSGVEACTSYASRRQFIFLRISRLCLCDIEGQMESSGKILSIGKPICRVL